MVTFNKYFLIFFFFLFKYSIINQINLDTRKYYYCFLACVCVCVKKRINLEIKYIKGIYLKYIFIRIRRVVVVGF